MSTLSLYAKIMNPFWKIRAWFKIKKRTKLRSTEEIIRQIEEFKQMKLAHDKRESKQESHYDCYIDVLNWVINND